MTTRPGKTRIGFLHRRQFGMTLIELMVALAIGGFLMIGALTVYMESRKSFRTNESVARLQENGRYVFDMIEPDIRMAHFWGLRTRTYAIDNRAGPDDAVSALGPAAADDCGVNWTINVDESVEGSNNSYGFACDPFNAAVATADTLVIRRASVEPVVPVANSLHLQASRGDNSALFHGTAMPGLFDPATSQTHRVVVNGYYVDQSSSTVDSLGNAMPSLRRKWLRHGNAGDPTIMDEEILPGVEDMQVQFGVDTDLVGGTGRGVVDRYVNPDDPILDPDEAAFNEDAEILAVRIWLRMRSDTLEPGIPDNAGFNYADQVIGPINDGFRRFVVSKTIYLRNARPAE